jgi:hypothetical protein
VIFSGAGCLELGHELRSAVDPYGSLDKVQEAPGPRKAAIVRGPEERRLATRRIYALLARNGAARGKRLGENLAAIMERLPKSMHRQVRRGLRQAWELPCAGKGAALPCYLATRPDKDWAEVAAAILEGPPPRCSP